MSTQNTYQASWLIDDTTCGPFVLITTRTEDQAPLGVHRKIAAKLGEAVLPGRERHGRLRVRFVPTGDVQAWSAWFATDGPEASLEDHSHSRVRRWRTSARALEE